MSLETPHRPGPFVLVVGPSGAGKDAIMRGARDRLGPDSGIIFGRRVVTRPADGSEDHDVATPEAFEEAARQGAFVLDWHAHGLRYGVPRRVLDDMARGEVVVVNGSRSVVSRARETLGPVRVALITAPRAVLEARILARGRDADPAGRITRDGTPLADIDPDIVIDNAGELHAAVEQFVGFLSRWSPIRNAE